MSEQFIIVSSTDQAIPADATEELAHMQMLVEQSIKERDPEVVLQYCANVAVMGRVSGFMIIRILYQLKKHWDEYDIGDAFKPTIYARIGFDKYTVDRYLRAAEVLDEMPMELEEKFANKNIKDIIPVTNAIYHGYDISENELVEIAEAPDYQTTMSLLRRAKGEEPTRMASPIKLDEDGQLWVWNEGTVAHIGFLKIKDTDKLVRRAIDRIISGAGIQR